MYVLLAKLMLVDWYALREATIESTTFFRLSLYTWRIKSAFVVPFPKSPVISISNVRNIGSSPLKFISPTIPFARVCPAKSILSNSFAGAPNRFNSFLILSYTAVVTDDLERLVKLYSFPSINSDIYLAVEYSDKYPNLDFKSIVSLAASKTFLGICLLILMLILFPNFNLEKARLIKLLTALPTFLKKSKKPSSIWFWLYCLNVNINFYQKKFPPPESPSCLA